jgi:hypothetical protein
MNTPRRNLDETLSPSQVVQMEKICTSFETCWKAGQRPRIEEYLGDAAGPERARLMRPLRFGATFRPGCKLCRPAIARLPLYWRSGMPPSGWPRRSAFHRRGCISCGRSSVKAGTAFMAKKKLRLREY